MCKVLICDKDDIFLHELRESIFRISGDRSIQVMLFSDEEQMEFYVAGNSTEANIIMINIKLERTSGIDLANKVLSLQPNAQIIFLSESDKHCLDAYSVEHVYLLKKPISQKHLEKSLNKALEHIWSLEKKSLMVSNKDGLHRVFINEILYFENERRKIHIHTIDRKISYYGKFEDLMDKLDERFSRCHNSYIVNISHVRELSDRKFYFDKDRTVPISKSYYSEVREHFLRSVESRFSRGGGTV